MAKNLTVRLDDELASDTEALGTRRRQRASTRLSSTPSPRQYSVAANDPEFKARVRRIIEEDRELLERLAK